MVSDAGPAGWLAWALGMRNMFVHRARRIQVSNLRTQPTGLVNAAKAPVLRTAPTFQLSLHPAWSDVEAFVATKLAPVLSEPMESTVEGIRASTSQLCEQGCSALLRLWSLRRADPSLIKQPKNQWDQFCSAPFLPFDGYAPGSLPFSPDFLVGNPQLLRRIEVACADDKSRHKWGDAPSLDEE